MALERRPVLSYADFLRLPPESPGEVVEGELIIGPSPASRHQLLVGRIFGHLWSFLEAHPELGSVYPAPFDVVLRADRPAVVLQPDVLFVSAAREHLIEEVMMGAPDLVVEVVSPSSKRLDPQRKRRLYEQHGVQEVWVVWPDEEALEIYAREGVRKLALADELSTPLLPGFSLLLTRLFAPRR